jgi:hypothetical protein
MKKPSILKSPFATRSKAAWSVLALSACLAFGSAQATAQGPRHHAKGEYDAATGIYEVVKDDDLSSWNDGPAKQAIMAFVMETTTQGSRTFVPQAERIATFDQDGTLWVEHPMYSQVVYCLERVPAVVKAKPELAQEEPFKTVLSGDREAIAKLSTDDLFKILAATLTGMDVRRDPGLRRRLADPRTSPVHVSQIGTRRLEVGTIRHI